MDEQIYANNNSTSLDDGEKHTAQAKRSRNMSDEHNEVCEVCDVGGDLLCCDTCSLVFHLKCIRPKLLNIPKGKWSCAHCIVDVNFFLL